MVFSIMNVDQIPDFGSLCVYNEGVSANKSKKLKQCIHRVYIISNQGCSNRVFRIQRYPRLSFWSSSFRLMITLFISVLVAAKKMNKYHHVTGDMKQILGDLDRLSPSSQRYYKYALQSCSKTTCACKESPKSINAGLTSVLKRLEPCPEITEMQTFDQWKQYVALNRFNRWFDGMKLKTTSLKLCLLPVGPFPKFLNCFLLGDSKKNFWNVLADFLRMFFSGCEVEILPECSISDLKVKKRKHSLTKQDQYLVTDLFPILKSKMSKDCFCIIAVSWSDLYPTEDLNFVLGQASFNHYCCVASFGRFDPTYLKGFKGNKVGIEPSDMKDISTIDSTLLWKVIKIVVHETCHVFGLNHCTMFSCLMNASSSSEEALNQPMLLCPICMRKIQHACSSWPKNKNLFDINVHLASLWQFFSLSFTQVIQIDEHNPSADMQAWAITSERAKSTIDSLEFLLNMK